MSCVTISGMAARAPVPETAMKSVHGIGLGIIAVHKVAVRHSRHTLLAPVSHMLNSVWTGILLDKALFFKIQPLPLPILCVLIPKICRLVKLIILSENII